MIGGLFNDESGVSETLGYIIIFGIVFTCIGIVIVSGNQIISNTEARTTYQGIQQSFTVLSSDLRKTAFDATPMRTQKIQYTGSMQFSPNDISITVQGTSSRTFTIGSLTFSSDSLLQSIKLEDDAVIESYGVGGNQSIMSQEPRMYISSSGTSNTLMVPIIDMKGASGITTNSTMGGSGVSTIQMSYNSAMSYPITPYPNNTVNIIVNTGNTNAWKNYLSGQFPTATVTTSNNVVTALIPNVNQATVIDYKIGISMS